MKSLFSLSLIFFVAAVALSSEDLFEVQRYDKTFGEWLSLSEEDPEEVFLMDIYLAMDAELEEKMLPALEYLLEKEPKINRKIAAVQILSQFNHKANEAIKLLLKASKDPDPTVQKEVMIWLKFPPGKIENWEYKEAMLELFLSKINDSDKETRSNALYGLGSLKANAKNTLPKVIEILKKDPDARVRFSAASTLPDIAKDSKEAVWALIEAMQKDPEGNVRHIAADALWKLRAGEAGPAFKEAAEKDPDGQVRAFAKEFAERMMELHESQKESKN